MKSLRGIIEAGTLKTFVSKPGCPLEPEQWAEIITSNIISVADSTQEPLRTMALDLRSGIQRILAHYVEEIRKEQKAYLGLRKE